MGCFLSRCVPDTQDDSYDQINDLLYPTEFQDSRTISQMMFPNLNQNDDKFIFIKNEAEIDKAINRFDDLAILSEDDADRLDAILNELRQIPKAYGRTLSSQPTEESIKENPEIEKHLNPLRSFIRDSTKDFSDLDNAERLTASSPLNKIFKEVRDGTLLLEIQKAHFMHEKLIKKHHLKNPHVVVKIYFDTKAKRTKGFENERGVEVASFSTEKSVCLLRPEWNDVFGYAFEQNERISEYKVGITMYYAREDIHKKGKKEDYLVGTEQIFAMTSFIDQRMQGKKIEFKDNILKGVIAKLNVRFQFVYDLEGIKEKILSEVRAKIWRLSKIREKHPVFQYGRGNKSLMQSVDQIMIDLSQSSISSIPESSEMKYFVAE